MHFVECGVLRFRKPADRFGVCASGCACAIRMSGLRDFLRQSGPGRWGFALTLFLVIIALGAPWIAPATPTAQNLPTRLEAPSLAHWMGTDALGRDILSRVIYGARVSMTVSVCVVLGAGIVGL